MSASGSRATVDINLDEFERRLRAAGTQQVGLEDPLSELARLVETSKPAPASPVPPATPGLRSAEPVEIDLRSSLDGDETVEGEYGPRLSASEAPEAGVIEAEDDALSQPSNERQSGGWKLRVSALAAAGVAMIGAVFALKGGLVPGLPKQPPYIAAAQGPTKVQPPSEDAVAAANDSGSTLLKDNAESAHVKVVTTEEQPVDLNAHALAAEKAPAASGEASNNAPIKGTVDTPVVVASAGSPPPVTPQFPDPKPVRTVSLRPDGTPVPSSATTDSSVATPVSEPAKPPAKPAQKATADAATAQPSTPKLDLPTKLPGKSSARVVVAKSDTSGVGAPAEATQLGAPAKSEKPAKIIRTQQAAAEPGPPASGAQQSVDPTVATTSGGWAVQVAAPKSEAEAKSTVARLNAKYASALNGSSIGVHRAVVNGETVYRLRVVGLSKADAAALCARVKGDGGDCFIAK